MIPIDLKEIRASANFINNELLGHFVSYDSFRFCLEIFHRVLFKSQPIVSPSLEIGIGDGFSSWFMHREKPNIDYGADMPFGATLESCGLNVPMKFDHLSKMIGMDMTAIPFPDQSFASIFSSHTMMYGQDLQMTFSEIMRVLSPGGTCAFCVDIEQWHQFKPLMDWIRAPHMMPTVQFFSKDHYLDLLRQAGATNIACRPFFQASLEAVLVGITASIPFKCRNALVNGIKHDPDIKKFFNMMREIFVVLIEKELELPEGPEDSFNVFISFQKPGELPSYLPVPEPVCPACQCPEFNRSPIAMLCSSCGVTYSIQAGVPIMINSEHPGYSPTPCRQTAELLSRTTDLLVHKLLAQISSDTFYIIDEGSSPVPFNTTTSILCAALHYQKRSIAGIYAPFIEAGRWWRGGQIVHAKNITATFADLLVLCMEEEHDLLIVKLQEANIHGRLWTILWSKLDGKLDARLIFNEI